MSDIAQDLGGVVRLLVPEPKPLPDLLLATYHEARGWNACREAMLKLIGTHSAEIAGALRDAERLDWMDAHAERIGYALKLTESSTLSATAYMSQHKSVRAFVDSAMQQGGGGG